MTAYKGKGLIYSQLEELPRLYQNKFFGNDEGHSLESVTSSTSHYVKRGYIEPPFITLDPSLTPEQIEDLGYYDYTTNLPDKSIEPFENLIDIRSGTKKLQVKLSKTAPTWPHKYFENKKGLSLQTVRENYRNHKRPFRNGYKILDKSGPIRSGPYRYYENKTGHSLETITQQGGLHK